MGDSILIVNYKLNKVPHKKLDKIPYELWKGRRPSYKYLKVCGCLAKISILDPKRFKIGSKTVNYVFIIYAYNSSACQFLLYKLIKDIHSNTIMGSKNVISLRMCFHGRKQKKIVYLRE